MMIPLFFSPHGIIAHHKTMWESTLESIRLSRATLPTTGLLILVFVLISEGLNVLWNIPEDQSWFLMIGIFGHAFITAALLAASFAYYKDADTYLRELKRQREARLLG